MESFLFWFCGGLMFLGGLMTVTQRNTVVSAAWLVFAFINAAGIFALLDAPFLAVMQVLVYAGAIMVLFIFVIMMLHGPVLEGERRLLPAAMWPLVAVPPVAVVIMVVGYLRRDGVTALGGGLPASFGSPGFVADLLLGRYLLAFEMISIVLLVAVIGALALGRGERKLPWQ